MKITSKLYLYQFILSLILFTFMGLTYQNYQLNYQKNLDNYIENEVNLYKKDIANSVSNAYFQYEIQKNIFKTIHEEALAILQENKNQDLHLLQQKFIKKYNLQGVVLEFYLINKQYKIFKTTYPKDLGLNLSLISEAKLFLDKTTKDNKIYIARNISLDILDMQYKLYSYSKLDEESYLELGFIDKNINNSIINIISNNYSNKSNLTLYNLTLYKNKYKYFPIQHKDTVGIKNNYYKEHILLSNTLNDNIIRTHIENQNIMIQDKNSVTVYSGIFDENMYDKWGYINTVMELKIDITENIKTLHSYQNMFFIYLTILIVFLLFTLIYTKKIFSEPLEVILTNIENKSEIKDTSILSKKDEMAIVANKYNTLFQSLNSEIEKNNFLLNENKQFIADMVHQIRTPLTVIMTNSSLIEMESSKFIHKYTDQINSSINMLSNSYEDLSYLISNETIEYPKIEVNISKFLENRILFFDTIAKANEKIIKSNIKENLSLLINDTELERLIDNNISNAIKYSNENSTITINLAETNNTIILEFVSGGKKISEPVKIFEKNYTLSNSAKRSLGLGLFMVKNICKKNNIEYSLDSSEGKNSFLYVFSKNIT